MTTIKINKTNMARLQFLYSGCVRFPILGNYEAQKDEHVKNIHVRDKINIATIESRLRYIKYKMYISWENTLSFAYLNNKEIDKELDECHKDIKSIWGKLIIIKS